MGDDVATWHNKVLSKNSVFNSQTKVDKRMDEEIFYLSQSLTKNVGSKPIKKFFVCVECKT